MKRERERERERERNVKEPGKPVNCRARQLQALVRRRLACRTKVHAQSKELPTIVVEEWHGLALPRTVSQGEAELSPVMKSESAQCEELYADAERSKVVAGKVVQRGEVSKAHTGIRHEQRMERKAHLHPRLVGCPACQVLGRYNEQVCRDISGQARDRGVRHV